MAPSTGIVSKFRKLPVTALAFLTDHHFLASNGGSLSVYSSNPSKCIGQKHIFAYARINGIVPLKSTGNDHRHRVLVFGSKSWSIVHIGLGSKVEIEIACQFLADDWIKAAHWAEHQATNTWYVCLALAHNQVHVCDTSTGAVVHCAQCEEHCILYSAAFFGSTIEELIIASGTVFNQVLIWPVLPASDKRLSPARSGQPDQIIRQRLSGHDGVIFCVRFSHDGHEIASVSDDRTVRLWSLQGEGAQPVAVLYGHHARIWSCLALDDFLISASEDGTCRVWDRRGGSDEIVPLDVWSQCKKHVWSLAINDSQTLVVSGGGDGSIRLWSLEAAFGKRVESEDVLIPVELPSQDTYLDPNISMPRPNEHIRGFALSSWNSSIVVTDSGYVLTNNLALNSWSTLYHSHSLVGYSMVATLPTGDLVAVGMLDGSVLLVSPANLFTPILHRLHTSKVQHLSLSSRPNSCTADKVFDLVTCDANGSILWTQALYGGELSWTAVATLTVPGRSQLSSVAVSKSLGWAAAGTANGNLFVYDLPSKLSGVHVEHFCIGTSEIPNLAPSISWHQAHGKYTVSTIAVMPSGTPGGCTVFTGGRDGVLNKFSVAIGSDQVAGSQARMASSQLRHGSAARQQTMYTGTLKNRHGLDPTPAVVVSRISTEKLTQGWIEQIAVHRDSLFAVTFYRKRLVLLDLLASSETLSIACGGAGRSWQVLLTESGIRVGFIKKRLLLTYGLPSAPKSISNPVVSDGVSSVDIRAISATLLPEMDGDVIVASGGEDCFLRVHKYSCPNSSPQQYPSFETLGQIRRHTSAIRCLEFAQPESASGATASYRYLFSAGASCELRCWRMEFTRDSRAINTKLVEWALAPLLGNDADSRIMDISVVEQWLCEGSLYITVAAGYSDASVRLWQLDVNRHQFICIAHDSSKAHNHCVLSVEHLALPDAGGRTLLFTGATNGQIAIWDITKFMGVKPPALSDSQPSDIGPAACMCEGAHMSGVNALDIMQIAGSGGFLVASGGDDNSISVNEFELDGDKGIIKQRAAGSHANAHASTVQAVRFVDGRIWSVSTDQRVAVWAVAKKQPSGVFGFELCDMAYTQVADPSSMAITQVPDRQMCLVAGIGVEAFELQGSGMDFMISTDSS